LTALWTRVDPPFLRQVVLKGFSNSHLRVAGVFAVELLRCPFQECSH